MSGAVLTAVELAPQILALVQSLVAVGAPAEQAWAAVSAPVKEGRAPSAAEWASANLTADQGHAAVQALAG